MRALPRTLIIIAGLVVVIAGVAAIASYVGGMYLTDSQYRTRHAGCSPSTVRHTVSIANGVVLPAQTSAHRCDMLVIINHDATGRLMAFGRHDSHVPYDGVEEQYLAQGQSLTITLDQTGEFLFHDHLHDEVQGDFTVR